jgi:hypothetical protein
MHLINPNIKPLSDLVIASISKQYSTLPNGETNFTASYDPSDVEKYAQNVFIRIAEIDNSFKNISITIEYLNKNNYSEVIAKITKQRDLLRK